MKNLINVDRNDVLDGGFRGFKRKSFNPHQLLSVKFSGENGIDTGGLTREFLPLAMREIKKQSIFHGSENALNLSMDYRGNLYYCACPILYFLWRALFFPPPHLRGYGTRMTFSRNLDFLVLWMFSKYIKNVNFWESTVVTTHYCTQWVVFTCRKDCKWIYLYYIYIVLCVKAQSMLLLLNICAI